MSFIVDTNVLSELSRQRPHPQAARWLTSIPRGELATTVISIAEIQCGIERRRKSDLRAAEELESWLVSLLGARGPDIRPLCSDASILLAKMYVTPELKNFIMPSVGQRTAKSGADLAIAAISIVWGATVATRDILHFRQIHACFPLPGLYNPFLDS